MGHMHAQRSNLRTTKTIKPDFSITPVQYPQANLIRDDPMPPTYDEIIHNQPPQTNLISYHTPTTTYADIL